MKARSALLVLTALTLLPAGARAQAERPQPTDEERQEIRELAGRVTGGRHPSLRSGAAGSLAAFGPKAELAVPALVTALSDRDSSVSSAAAIALGKVGLHSKEAVAGLTRALTRGREPAVKTAAAEGLGLIGPNAASATPQLVDALGSEDGDLRREAASALGYLGAKAKPAVPRLLPLLQDGEARVRLCAAISATRLEDRSPELVGVLAAGVPKASGTPIELRQRVCDALGLLGPGAASAVPVLIEALGERHVVNPAIPYATERQAAHDAMRRAAATALGEIGDPAAVEPLERAAEVSALEEAARAALAKLGG